MRRLYNRIISGVFAVVTFFSLCVPISFASDDVSINLEFDTTDLLSWLVKSGTAGWNWLTSLVNKEVCPHSIEAGGYHKFVEKHTQVDGQIGYFYICEYCGKSAGEVGKEAYDNQVAELPATGITSAGRLLWQPTVKDIVFPFTFRGLLDTSASVNALPWSHVSGASESSLSSNLSGTGFDMRVYNCTSIVFAELSIKFAVPVSGSYCCGPYSFSYSVVSRPNGEIVSDNISIDGALSFFNVLFGDTISFNFKGTFQSALCSSGAASFSFPIYQVIPDSAIDTSAGGQYSVNTRPTSITGGNYGIVGDDGEITTITNNNQIVNETNNTYYNPATGQTSTITDWSYNYDGRIYDLTLDTGDKVSVEYGDQNITIIEGNTTYIVYYMIDGSGIGGDDPVPSSPVCPHDWQESSRTGPTCTAPGKVEYTCSQCGQTKTETIPALGHDWEVVRTVPTEYDENGVQTQEGYTLYECTRCGEQYKDADGTGPPGGSGDTSDDGESIWDKIGNFFGTIFEGILGMIEAVVSKILDGLIALGEMLMEKLTAVVETVLTLLDEVPKLFGGFLDFLSAMFPYLPDDIILLLTFGIAAVVFVGIIKAIRR